MAFLLGSPTPNSQVSITPQRGLGQGFNFARIAKTKLLDFLDQEFGYASTFSFLVSNITTLTQFDWNATDEEIKSEYEAMKSGLASASGALVGRGIGSMVAISLGGFAGLTVPKISGAALARESMKAGSEEAKEEIADEALSVIQYMKNSATKVLVLESYIRFRTFLKGVNEPVLAAMFGPEAAKYIKRVWGTKTAPEFRIAEKFEEKIEKIKNPLLKTFVEEAFEEGFESFIEVGMIISIQLDESLQQYLMGTGAGSERTIEVIPDSNNPNESYILENVTNDEAEREINQFINNWRVARQNYLNTLTQPAFTAFSNSPSLRTLVLFFFSAKDPSDLPPDRRNVVKVQVTIVNAKKPLKWKEIKRTALCYADYAWEDGNYTVRQRLEGTGGRTKLVIKAKTSEEAIKVINELAKLSENKLIDTPSITDCTKKRKQRRVQKLYPLWGCLMTKTVTADERREFEDNANAIGFQRDYFPLYVDDEPLDLPDYLK
jgi:hypothetical protein